MSIDWAWPTLTDYQEALQHPLLSFRDVDLRLRHSTLDTLGLPRPITGGFASVYHLTNGGRSFAVRCFLRRIPDLQQRYEAISTTLKQAQLRCFVDFEWLTQGIQVHGKWYPVLKMEWIEGLTLDKYVEQVLQDSSKLRKLSQEWLQIISEVRRKGIAHGDMQHGNILVQDGTLRLIDYDGMYVPTLSGWKSNEQGHPAYQHPLRSTTDYNADLDRFSSLVIYLALKSLALRPDLWKRYYTGDNLCFRRDDFLDPDQSDLLHELSQVNDPELTHLVLALREACHGPVSRAPDLSTLLSRVEPVPARHWWQDQVPSIPAKPIAEKQVFSFTIQFECLWASPGFLKQKQIRSEPVYSYRLKAVTRHRTVLRPVKFLGILWGHRTEQEDYLDYLQERYISGYRPVEEWLNITISGRTDSVSALCFAQNAKVLLSGSDDGTLLVSDVTTGLEHRRFRTGGSLTGIVAPVNAGWLACFSQVVKSQVTVYNLDGSLKAKLRVPEDSYVNSICTSLDGRLFAVGIGKRTIHVWGLKGNDFRYWESLKGHGARISGVAFMPNSEALVSCSWDRTVRIWNLLDGTTKRILYGHNAPVRTLAISADGSFVASGDEDGTVILWDLPNGGLFQKVAPSHTAINCLAVSPDGLLVAAGSEEGKIRFFSTKGGQEIGRIDAHKQAVRTLQFSPSGEYLGSGGDDRTVRLWKRIR